MSDLSSEPWIEFAENFSNELVNHKVTEGITITRCDDEERIATNYYNCSFEMRWSLLSHVFVDLVIQTLKNNKELVLEILNSDDEEEEINNNGQTD